MRTIWKYELDRIDVQKVSMPKDAILLHVGTHGATPILWAWVDSSLPQADRLIGVIGTGNPAPEPGEAVFVGTVEDGPFVWHIFDGGWVQRGTQ